MDKLLKAVKKCLIWADISRGDMNNTHPRNIFAADNLECYIIKDKNNYIIESISAYDYSTRDTRSATWWTRSTHAKIVKLKLVEIPNDCK